jgi:glycosyltransferase involved in cell wall biosynthesis
MERKKILFVIPSMRGGGEERIAVYLVNHVDRQHYEPILALGAVEGPYLEDVHDDVVIHKLGANRTRGAVSAILRAVWSLRPDVVVSFLGFNLATALICPLFPSGTRVILRQGSTATAYLSEVEQNSVLRATLYRLLYRTIYRLPDAVICQCDFMLDDLAKGFSLPKRNMVRIYNPVDVEKVPGLANEEASPYVGTGPHLLTIGNMSYAKGYDILLPAFKSVRERHPKATLTFVGDGENRDRLENLTEELELCGAVRFAGFQSNPFIYMKHADLFVSSSRYEGLAFVILEALACGAPVVATDCPSGIREVIREGFNGWLATPEDVSSLAQTISKAITEYPTFDRDAIRAECVSRFSIEQILPQYEKQFEK